MNENQLRDFAQNAQRLIDQGAVEDRLRHYLSAHLSEIFPDHPWWLEAHLQGTEEHVRFAGNSGDRTGFVDAVVGKTAIEYEKNLTIQGIFNEGYHQVEEYCAALCNAGVPENEVLGVLSDTVRWYGYKVRIVSENTENRLLGPDDVELEQVCFVDLSVDRHEEFMKFDTFINRFLARDGSRLLNANTLVLDFGIDSTFYRKNQTAFRLAVENAMNQNPDYAHLIQNVWQNFIAYLGGSNYQTFSVDTYINEFYLVTVAKIICVNVLAEESVISTEQEIIQILNGSYFMQQNIHNFVDYDYFGWLKNQPFVDVIVPAAMEMQNTMRAYDFTLQSEEDIFGRLLAQLADKDHRLMLGQEFTPHWIARDIVAYNMDKLTNKPPRFLDMCCGSGVFLIEAIRAVRERDLDNDLIFSCVMGFDIDPLAVILAKVNWIIAMRDLFEQQSGSITVPIYHADSLFIATPISHKVEENSEEFYTLNIYDKKLRLPAFILTPDNRKLFDSFMAKVYGLAMARARSASAQGEIDSVSLMQCIGMDCNIPLDEERESILEECAIELITELEALQRQGRNGIWHFIICNCYRPGLTKHQFNCIVSNPPWMAMSKLEDNPYKGALRKLAIQYNIKPEGASHPHMELATIFLLSSVDRYLEDDAIWSVVMPASIMNGINHEGFRRARFKDAGLNTCIDSVWELPISTFKNKAIVISGKKHFGDASTMAGRVYECVSNFQNCDFALVSQGKRSAWTSKGADTEVVDAINDSPWAFNQGGDLMPRTILFHRFSQQANGTWSMAPIEKTNFEWYLVSDAKKRNGSDMQAQGIRDEYIYDAFISKHLSPFLMTEPAKMLMPGRKVQGIWKQLDDQELALMNPGTAYVFQIIDNEIGDETSLGVYLDEKINIYGKLYKQNFSLAKWLVLSNAGGSNPCAAFIDLDEYDRTKIVIDQTLYWYPANDKEEAVYITGMLNSQAISLAIADFQPDGGFGKRHIHTLPYKIIPKYDPNNPLHNEVISATENLMSEWIGICETDEIFRGLLSPNRGSLNSRRRTQQKKIRELSTYSSYETACESVLL